LNGYLPSSTRRIVSRSKIDNVVDDIVKLLEYAKGFPRRTLDVGGSTVAKSHNAH
jgi:N-acetyl-beta-hexosaminidase